VSIVDTDNADRALAIPRVAHGDHRAKKIWSAPSSPPQSTTSATSNAHQKTDPAVDLARRFA
jgi:hypothetical protein